MDTETNYVVELLNRQDKNIKIILKLKLWSVAATERGDTDRHWHIQLLSCSGWPLWPVIQCEMVEQWPRWSDKRLFNIYFVLCHGYSITVIVLTQSTLMQPVNGSQRHLWAVQCHSFNEFPITCYRQGVYKVWTLFFFNWGFIRERI